MVGYRLRNYLLLASVIAVDVTTDGPARFFDFATGIPVPGSALAGSGSSGSSGSKDNDALRRAQEQAAQQQQQQQQAQERARQERDKPKSQEQQSSSSKQDQQSSSSKQDQQSSGSDSNSGSGSSNRDETSGAATRSALTGGDERNSGDGNSKRTATDKPRAESDKTRREALEDDKVPSTVAEWLQKIFKPATAPTTVGTKHIATTGSTPTAAPSPSSATAKAQKLPPARTVGRDGLPSFPLVRPEVLASNMSAKSLERAVALGFRANGTSRVSRLDLNLTRLIAPDGMSADEARDLLRQAAPGASVESNQTYHIYRTATGALPASQSETVRPAVPMATSCGTDRCFGPSIINWQPQLQECARAVKVGVIDTGYDASHPTFRARVIETRRSSGAEHAKSPDWHGTGVLALLAGDTKSGTPGLIPDAKFYSADIFYAGADGLPTSDTASLLDALDWLDKRQVNVINMSLSGPPDELLKVAIEGLSRKNIIFVAAAGNDGPTAPPSYPAAYSPVIAVTAVSRDLKSYRYASRGDHIDVAAPGVEIWTALPGGRGAYHSGTSFAVPYVTAVLATAYKGLATKTKASFLKQATVLDLGAPGRDPVYGQGLLLAPTSCSADISVAAAKAPALATATAPSGLMVQASGQR